MAEVSAPASSGNLGPGFDVIGLALELRCRVRAVPSDTWSSEHVGPEVLIGGAEDIVLTAAKEISSDLPLALTVHNEIPLGRGLGSSSAAAAAGAAAAMLASSGALDRDRVCDLVAEFEGHADNAAATVHGGLVGITGDGAWIGLEMHPDWRVVVAVAAHALPTSEARRALRPDVPRPAIVRNLGRLIGLVEGLRTGAADVLKQAAGDELHESCRADLYPDASSLMAAAVKAGAAHSCWSGAGPSILAFAHEPDVEAVIEGLVSVSGDARVGVLEVATAGLEVLST